MDPRFEALAELAVFGANVQPGQRVGVTAALGQEEAARAVAAAAYRRGAQYVDVLYSDPYLKRARVQNADPGTLGFVPEWMPHRLEGFAARGDARISFTGIVQTDAFEGLDPMLVGRDHLPWLKELGRIISDRATNWCGVPVPTRVWAKVVHPELGEEEAYDRLWEELHHVLRLDEPDPAAAWTARASALNASSDALNARGFQAVELRGPGTELTIGLLPSSRWMSAALTTRSGISHFPNLPTEEVFTTPDPVRTEGYVTSTRPLVLSDGPIVRGLRVRFEGGRAVEIDADENGDALRARTGIDEGGVRLGELALVDRHGRIGPLDTVFYDTLLDENAASHIAFGSGFGFAVGDEDAGRINDSGVHIDFMIGSPDLQVDGVDADGDRVAILRDGDWLV